MTTVDETALILDLRSKKLSKDTIAVTVFGTRTASALRKVNEVLEPEVEGEVVDKLAMPDVTSPEYRVWFRDVVLPQMKKQEEEQKAKQDAWYDSPEFEAQIEQRMQQKRAREGRASLARAERLYRASKLADDLALGYKLRDEEMEEYYWWLGEEQGSAAVAQARAWYAPEAVEQRRMWEEQRRRAYEKHVKGEERAAKERARIQAKRKRDALSARIASIRSTAFSPATKQRLIARAKLESMGGIR